MKTYTHELTEKINSQLKTIDLEEDGIFTKASQAIIFLEDIFVELKSFILAYTFKDMEEEIYFFKEVKPLLFSKLIYYRKIYNIETIHPSGCIDSQKAHLKKELDHIKTFFDRNLDFYKYYRIGGTHFDKYYFVRGKPDIQLNLDSFYFERDSAFSTIFDFKLAKLLANDVLTTYLNTELIKLQQQKEQQINTDFTQRGNEKWTEQKTALVELIYGIHTTQSLNYGNVDIKVLAAHFEKIFNIELGDVYRIFLEIRGRKGDRTVYLNRMIEALNKRMDDADNK